MNEKWKVDIVKPLLCLASQQVQLDQFGLLKEVIGLDTPIRDTEGDGEDDEDRLEGIVITLNGKNCWEL